MLFPFTSENFSNKQSWGLDYDDKEASSNK